MTTEKQKKFVANSTYNRADRKANAQTKYSKTGDSSATRKDQYEKNLGKDYPVLRFMGSLGEVVDSAMTGAGNAIDKGFDDTLGTLVYNATGQAIDPRQWASGEGVGTALDIGTDLGAFAINPIFGSVFSGTKAALQNADRFAEALSGRDLQTGEALSEEQQLMKGGSALGNTALMFMPGLGGLGAKGFLKSAGKGLGKRAEKYLATPMEEKEGFAKVLKDIEEKRAANVAAVESGDAARASAAAREMASSGRGYRINPETGAVEFETVPISQEAQRAAVDKEARERLGIADIPEEELDAASLEALNDMRYRVSKEATENWGRDKSGLYADKIYDNDYLGGINSKYRTGEGSWTYSREAQKAQDLEEAEKFTKNASEQASKKASDLRSAAEKEANDAAASAEKIANEYAKAQEEFGKLQADLEKFAEEADAIGSSDIALLYRNYENEMQRYLDSQALYNGKMSQADFIVKHGNLDAAYAKGAPAPKFVTKEVLKAKGAAKELQSENLRRQIDKFEYKLDDIAAKAASVDVGATPNQVFADNLDTLVRILESSTGKTANEIRNEISGKLGSNEEIESFLKNLGFDETVANQAKRAEEFAGYESRLGNSRKLENATNDDFARMAFEDEAANFDSRVASGIKDAEESALKNIAEKNEARVANAEEINRINTITENLSAAFNEARGYTGANFRSRFDENGWRSLLRGNQQDFLATERGINDAAEHARYIGQKLRDGSWRTDFTASDYEFLHSLAGMGRNSREAKALYDIIYAGDDALAEGAFRTAERTGLGDLWESASKSAQSAIEGNSKRAGRLRNRANSRDLKSQARYDKRTGIPGALKGLPGDWAAMAANGYANLAGEVGPENANEMIAQNPSLWASMALAGLVGRPVMRRLPTLAGRRQAGPTRDFAFNASNIPYRMLAAGAMGTNIGNQQAVDDDSQASQFMRAVGNAINEYPLYKRGYQAS